MSTIEECEAALTQLVATLRSAPDRHKAQIVDRSLSCRITDLGVTFTGEIHNGELCNISTGDGSQAQIKLALTSDDLLALTKGTLKLAAAWSTGRVKIHASVLDLLVLRKLL